MNHYYTKNDDLRSEPREIRAVFSVYGFSFFTDIGVFSKDAVDYGTRTLIDTLIMNVSNQEMRILDVGCGYGPIGIVLGKLYPKLRIDMVDINDRAIELTKKNIVNNEISNADVFSSNIYENVEGEYSIIISNPPIRAGKHIVHTIIEQGKQYLEDDGELWIVIQKKQGAASAKKKMFDTFGNAEVVRRNKGYFIIRSKS